MYVSLNSIMLQSALIWFFCYHSSLVTIRMGQVAEIAYSMPWYTFSMDSQKCVTMMIQRSNQHFGYSGLGILQCDLQTLSMVNESQSISSLSFPHKKIIQFQMINSVVSYYLLLKRI